MGMRTDDSWDVHGLSDGSSVSIAVSEFNDDFEFFASGNAPAIFELAAVWTAVKAGANRDKVRELLDAAQRGRTTPRT